MAPYDIVKAGWLYRESTFLRRWKKNWFVLYEHGELKYFESQDSHYAEEVIVMVFECMTILVGSQCGDIRPPDKCCQACLLAIVCYGEKKWQLCGESPDDARAWQIALEQAKTMRPRSAPRFPQAAYRAPPTYFNQGFSPYQTTSPGTTYIYPGQYGTVQHVVQEPGRTLIYTDRPYHGRRRHGDGVATGLLAGAAIGSLFFWPFMCGPFLWF